LSSFVITQFSDTASVEKEKQARPTPDAVDGYHHLVRANDQLMQKLQQMALLSKIKQFLEVDLYRTRIFSL